MKFSFIHLIRFLVDNARFFLRVSSECQYDCWSSRMSTIVPTY